MRRDDGEDAVRLNRIRQLHDVVEIPQPLREQARHRVGVRGVAQPQVVVQQRLELRGDVPHLRGELHPLLARVREDLGRRVRAREDDCLAEHHPVLRPAEAADVDPGLDQHRPQVDAERRDGVRDPRAVDVEEQAMRAGALAEHAQFVDRVDGSDLGRLRDRDRGRLDVVRIADAVQLPEHVGRRELPVLDRDVDQLAAREALEGAALVDVEMRELWADHRLVRSQRGGERDHVRPGSVPAEEYARVRTQLGAEGALDARRTRIVAVTRDVSGVGRGERGQHVGMDAGIVVAGEGARRGGSRLHRPSRCGSRRPRPYWVRARSRSRSRSG